MLAHAARSLARAAVILSISVTIYLSMFSAIILLPDLEEIDEIWQAGPSWALVLIMRKLTPDIFVAIQRAKTTGWVLHAKC